MKTLPFTLDSKGRARVILMSLTQPITSTVILYCPRLNTKDVVLENSIEWRIFTKNNSFVLQSLRSIDPLKYCLQNCIVECSNDLSNTWFGFSLEYVLPDTISIPKDFMVSSLSKDQFLFSMSDLKRQYFVNDVSIASVSESIEGNVTYRILEDSSIGLLINNPSSLTLQPNYTNILDDIFPETLRNATNTLLLRTSLFHKAFNSTVWTIENTFNQTLTSFVKENMYVGHNVKFDLPPSSVQLEYILQDSLSLASNQYGNLISTYKSKYTPKPMNSYVHANSIFNKYRVETSNFHLTPSGSLLYVPRADTRPAFTWTNFRRRENAAVEEIYTAYFLKDSPIQSNRILEYAESVMNNHTFRRRIGVDHHYVRKSLSLYAASQYSDGLHPTVGTLGLEFSVGLFQVATLHYTLVSSIDSSGRTSNSRDWNTWNTYEYAAFEGYKYYYAETKNGEEWRCHVRGYYARNCAPRSSFENLINKRLPYKKVREFEKVLQHAGHYSLPFVSGITQKKVPVMPPELNIIEKYEFEILRRIFEYRDLMRNWDVNTVLRFSKLYMERVLRNLDSQLIIGQEAFLAEEFISKMHFNLSLPSPRFARVSHSLFDALDSVCHLDQVDLLAKPLPQIYNVETDFTATTEMFARLKDAKTETFSADMKRTLNVLDSIESDFRKDGLSKLKKIYENKLIGSLELSIAQVLPQIRELRVKTFATTQAALNIGWFLGQAVTALGVGMLFSDSLRVKYDDYWTIEDENSDQFRERKGLDLLESVFERYDATDIVLTDKEKRIVALASILRLCSFISDCDDVSLLQSLFLLISFNDKDIGPQGTKIVRKGLPFKSKIIEFNVDVIPQAIILMGQLDSKTFAHMLHEEFTEQERIQLYNIEALEFVSLIIPNGFDINIKDARESSLPHANVFMSVRNIRLKDFFSFLSLKNPEDYSFANPSKYASLIKNIVASEYNNYFFQKNLEKLWGLPVSLGTYQPKKLLQIAVDESGFVILKNVVGAEYLEFTLKKIEEQNNRFLEIVFTQGFDAAKDAPFHLIREDLDIHVIFKNTLRQYVVQDRPGHMLFYGPEFLFNSLDADEKFYNVICACNDIEKDKCSQIFMTAQQLVISVKARIPLLYGLLELFDERQIKVPLPPIFKLKVTTKHDEDNVFKKIIIQNAKFEESKYGPVLSYEDFRYAELQYRDHVLKREEPLSVNEILAVFPFIISNFQKEEPRLISSKRYARTKEPHVAFQFKEILKELYVAEIKANFHDYSETFLSEIIPSKCHTVNLIRTHFTDRRDRAQSFELNYYNLFKPMLEILSCNMNTRWCNLVLAKLAKVNYFELSVLHGDDECISFLNNEPATYLMSLWVTLNATFLPITGSWDKVEYYLLEMEDALPKGLIDFYAHIWNATDDDAALLVDVNSISQAFFAEYICEYFKELLYIEGTEFWFTKEDNHTQMIISADNHCLVGQGRLLRWNEILHSLFGLNFALQNIFDSFFQNVKMLYPPTSFNYIPELLNSQNGNIEELLKVTKLNYNTNRLDKKYLRACQIANFHMPKTSFKRANLDLLLSSYLFKQLRFLNYAEDVVLVKRTDGYVSAQMIKLMNFFKTVVDVSYADSTVKAERIKRSWNNKLLNTQPIMLTLSSPKSKPDRMISPDVYREVLRRIDLDISGITLNLPNAIFEKDVRKFFRDTIPGSYDFKKVDALRYSNTKQEGLLLYLFSLGFAYENYVTLHADEIRNIPGSDILRTYRQGKYTDNYFYEQKFGDYGSYAKYKALIRKAIDEEIYRPRGFKNFRTRELEFLMTGIAGPSREKVRSSMCESIAGAAMLSKDEMLKAMGTESVNLSKEEMEILVRRLASATYYKDTVAAPFLFLTGMESQMAKMMRNDDRPFYNATSLGYSHPESMTETMSEINRHRCNPAYNFRLDSPYYLLLTRGFTETSYDPRRVFGTEAQSDAAASFFSILFDIALTLLPIGGPMLAGMGKNAVAASKRLLASVRVAGKNLIGILRRVQSSARTLFQRSKASLSRFVPANKQNIFKNLKTRSSTKTTFPTFNGPEALSATTHVDRRVIAGRSRLIARDSRETASLGNRVSGNVIEFADGKETINSIYESFDDLLIKLPHTLKPPPPSTFSVSAGSLLNRQSNIGGVVGSHKTIPKLISEVKSTLKKKFTTVFIKSSADKLTRKKTLSLQNMNPNVLAAIRNDGKLIKEVGEVATQVSANNILKNPLSRMMSKSLPNIPSAAKDSKLSRKWSTLSKDLHVSHSVERSVSLPKVSVPASPNFLKKMRILHPKKAKLNKNVASTQLDEVDGVVKVVPFVDVHYQPVSKTKLLKQPPKTANAPVQKTIPLPEKLQYADSRYTLVPDEEFGKLFPDLPFEKTVSKTIEPKIAMVPKTETVVDNAVLFRRASPQRAQRSKWESVHSMLLPEETVQKTAQRLSTLREFKPKTPILPKATSFEKPVAHNMGPHPAVLKRQKRDVQQNNSSAWTEVSSHTVIPPIIKEHISLYSTTSRPEVSRLNAEQKHVLEHSKRNLNKKLNRTKRSTRFADPNLLLPFTNSSNFLYHIDYVTNIRNRFYGLYDLNITTTLFADYNKNSSVNEQQNILYDILNMFSHTVNGDPLRYSPLEVAAISNIYGRQQYCDGSLVVQENPLQPQNLGNIAPDLHDQCDPQLFVLKTLMHDAENSCTPHIVNVIVPQQTAVSYHEVNTLHKVLHNNSLWISMNNPTLLANGEMIVEDGVILPEKFPVPYFSSVSAISQIDNNTHQLYENFMTLADVPHGETDFYLVNVALTKIDYKQNNFITPLRNTLDGSLFSSKVLLHTLLSQHLPSESIFWQDGIHLNADGVCDICMLIDARKKTASFVRYRRSINEEENKTEPILWTQSERIVSFSNRTIIDLENDSRLYHVFVINVIILLFLSIIACIFIGLVGFWLYRIRLYLRRSAEQHEQSRTQRIEELDIRHQNAGLPAEENEALMRNKIITTL